MTYVRLDIEVLKIESVFPNIDTNDRDKVEQRILVGSGRDLKTLRTFVIALYRR